MKKIISILIFTLFILSACKLVGGPWNRYINREIKPFELVGNWVISDNSLYLLQEDGFKDYLSKSDHNINIRADGSCLFSTFNWYHYVNDTGLNSYNMNFEGKWTIEKRRVYKFYFKKEAYALVIKPVNNDKCISTNLLNGEMVYYIHEDGGKLILWDFVGDPDYWKFVEFYKT